MIVTNLKTNEVFECNRTDAAKKIGISRKQLWVWECVKKKKVEVYNHFEVRFTEVKKIKQKRGFAINPQNIKKNNINKL